MTQDINNPKHYTTDEGKVFQRISNGFTQIENPFVVGPDIILGEILVNEKGEKLDTPIEDKIEYYAEIDIPEPENNISND